MIEIIETALDELVIGFGAVRWRRNYEATAEDVDGLVGSGAN